MHTHTHSVEGVEKKKQEKHAEHKTYVQNYTRTHIVKSDARAAQKRARERACCITKCSARSNTFVVCARCSRGNSSFGGPRGACHTHTQHHNKHKETRISRTLLNFTLPKLRAIRTHAAAAPEPAPGLVRMHYLYRDC